VPARHGGNGDIGRRTVVLGLSLGHPLLGNPVDLVSLDADGRRSFRMEWVAGPGLVLVVSSFAGSAFVITDEDARAMCTFVLGDKDAVADVDRACRYLPPLR
jgi:hypothetical protein